MKKSDIQLLKAEIERIHRNNSGDYESLMRQTGRKFRMLKRNAAQVLSNHYDPIRKKKTAVLSRGVGKTTFIGDHMSNVSHAMPRSAGNVIVPSYKKFRKEMLPALNKSLEMLGYFEGLHYFIGSKPPRNWNCPRPWMKPDDYSNIIYWTKTGAIQQIVSQDIAGAGRALSVDYEIRDEAALLNKVKLEEATSATLRGSNVAEFRYNPYFGSVWNLSSMPLTLEGAWLLEEEKYALIDPSKHAYFEFDVGCNLENLRAGYVTDAKQTALFDWIFRAEFLNERPQLTLGAFYALLNESKHGYVPMLKDFIKHDDCRYDYGDDNLHANSPLILGVDWGSRINYMAVNQLRHEKDGLYLRALNEFWALGEDNEIQSDMVRKFAEYYKVFPHKRIILFCDRQGNNRTGMTNETRVQMLMRQLYEYGWSVELGSFGGANPPKDYIRLLWENVLKEADSNLLKFRVNLLNCRNLLISMQNAPTKTNQNKTITKDKKSEKINSGIHPTQATDPSDAEDQVMYGILGSDFFNNFSALPPIQIGSF